MPRPFDCEHNPHHIHRHHHMGGKHYSPSTKNDDISRLLDPSYASSSNSPTNHYNQAKVYVDHHGDLHDPDYRHFPSMPSFDASKRPRRQRRDNSADPFHGYRPSWETGDDFGLLEDEDDDYLLEEDRYHSHRPHSRRSSSLSRQSPPSRHSPLALPYTYTYSSSSNSPTYSSPVSSYESEDTVLGDLDEADELSSADVDEKEKLRKKKRSLLVPKPCHSPPLIPDDEEPKPEQAHDESKAEDTPSCSDALRKEWHAMALSVRFSIFRMRRRVRGVVG